MSSLQEFLNANPVDNLTAEVTISDRFKDQEGNVLKFKIKAMTNQEFEMLRKKALKPKKGGKFEFDSAIFNNDIVLNYTVVPDFKDAESIKKMGCTSPEQYLGRVLLAGEVQELAQQISKLSGFDQDMDELIEEAKN